MEELIHTEYNCTTGEIIVRPFTEEERAQHEEVQRISAERLAAVVAAEEARAAAKASAEAKLAAIGLTADEIASL